MDDKNKTFREKLDQLISLFKKVRARTEKEKMPGFDKSLFFNFDMVLNNYEMIKNHLSDDILEQFGEPIQHMIEKLIEQLKDELGEVEESVPEIKEIRNDIIEIDELLKTSELSNDQINELLDKRTEIKNNDIKEI